MKHYNYSSQSQNGVSYEVTVDGGKVICECIGFAIHGHCRHQRVISTLVVQGVEFLGEW